MTAIFQDHEVLSAPNNIRYNQEQCLLLLAKSKVLFPTSTHRNKETLQIKLT